MTRKVAWIAALVLAASVGSAFAAAGSASEPARIAAKKPAPVPFAEADLFIEVNATGGDAGLQIALDAKPWKSVTIYGPGGGQLVGFRGEGKLSDFGLTELRSESSEPPFDVFPLWKFKALWPEGTYLFRGETVEGRRLVGKARLTHDIPSAPVVVAPVEDAVVPEDDAVVVWSPVTEPGGIDIVGYQVIVTREEPLRVFSVDLPASATSVTVPPEFLEPSTEYSLEVLARERSGNQTITEVSFVTA